jgi:hypothetical protein
MHKDYYSGVGIINYENGIIYACVLIVANDMPIYFPETRLVTDIE